MSVSELAGSAGRALGRAEVRRYTNPQRLTFSPCVAEPETEPCDTAGQRTEVVLSAKCLQKTGARIPSKCNLAA